MLTTDRTYMKPLAKSDYADILEMFQDNDALDYIPHLQNQDEAYYVSYLNNKLNILIQGRGYYWVARLADGDDFLGCINVTPISREDPRVQIGWIVKRKYWKQGFAKELAIEAFRCSSEDLGIDIVYGFFDKKNVASKRIFDQMPFDFIGVEGEDDTQVYRYTKEA